MSQLLGYEWRLREQMAAAGMFSTTKLSPLLEERGIHLSASQVYRLVAEKPERLNLQVLVALTDILNCTPNDLIVRVDLGAARSDIAVGEDLTTSAAQELRSHNLRPARARVKD